MGSRRCSSIDSVARPVSLAMARRVKWQAILTYGLAFSDDAPVMRAM
jgi:hypothetical protein